MKLIKKIFQSSTGEGLAKRWESFFSGIIPALVAVSEIFDLGLVEANFNELNGYIVTAIASAVALWKAIDHTYGWIRRNIYKKNNLGKFAE